MAIIPRTRQTRRIRYDQVLFLLAEDGVEQDAIGNQHLVVHRRKVKGQRLEISNLEYFNPTGEGIRAEFQLEIFARLYQGERRLEYKGQLYNIVRSRMMDDRIRLACQMVAANVGADVP